MIMQSSVLANIAVKADNWCPCTALGKPPNHYNIWMSALCQSLTTLLADFVSLACDWKYHAIDYSTHWVTNMRIFLMYILIIITVGSSR
jgi:hypothetical protein